MLNRADITQSLEFQINHWHLEVSSKCVLRCPRCPRNEEDRIQRMGKELSLADIQSIFSGKYLAASPLRITMCGDLGDPIYASEFLEIVAYLKKANPNIHLYIITNGSYKPQSWWQSLGRLLNENDTVAFSIDGYDQDSNNKYRVNSDFASALMGISTLSKESSAYLVWALIVFSFNEDKLEEIQELARKSGIDEFQITKSTKFGSVYDHYVGETGKDPLEPSSKWIAEGHRYEREARKLSSKKRHLDTYYEAIRKNFENTKKKYGAPVLPLCVVGNRGLFVSADGQLWPCSWVSYPHKGLESPITPGRIIEFKDSFFVKNSEAFNLKKNSVESVLENALWKRLNQGFMDPEKTFIECEKKCYATTLREEDVLQYNTN